MTKAIFNGRLYGQALWRLRILGLALAILSISVSVLVPVCSWIADAERVPPENVQPGYSGYDDGFVYAPEEDKEGSSDEIEPYELEDNILGIAAVVASYLSPVLILFMFNFLNHRKDSDFYHAIPYTRACVYLSFGAAAMTWMVGVLIAGGLVEGLVWAVDPYVTFSFGALLGQIALACLNALFLASFACAVVSLTGTEGTACVAFLLAIGFWRVILACFAGTLECCVPMLVYDDVWSGYCSPYYMLPIGLFQWMIDVDSPMSTGQIVYAAVVTVALFALGGLFYAKRKSELAGRAVPGKIVQIVIRTAITLPVAILGTYLLLSGDLEASTLLIFIVAVLLVYFLYELLTTKSAKSMLRATPWLGLVLGGCILFTGAVWVQDYAVAHEDLSAERIESVRLYRSHLTWYGVVNDPLPSDYVLYQMTKTSTDDPQVIELMAHFIEGTQKDARREDYYNGEDGTIMFYLEIELENGRTVVRRLKASATLFSQAIEYWQAAESLTSLPKTEEVVYAAVLDDEDPYNCSWQSAWLYESEQIEKLMKALMADWEDMNEDERDILLGNAISLEGTASHELMLYLDESSLHLYPPEGSRTAELMREYVAEQNGGGIPETEEKDEETVPVE